MVRNRRMPSKRVMAIMDESEKKALKKPRKKTSKTYKGKSMKLGQGGRAAKLRDQLTKKGLPKSEVGGIIGKIARSKGAAPGQKNYH